MVNTGNDAALGHVHLDKIAQHVKAGIWQAGGTPFEFGTISTCGEISIGTPHLRHELVIRDIIASSIEIMANVELFDGLVLLASCNSIIPGVIIGALRTKNVAQTWFTEDGEMSDKVDTWDGTITPLPNSDD